MIRRRRPRPRPNRDPLATLRALVSPSIDHSVTPGKHISNVCFGCLLSLCSLSLLGASVHMKLARHTWQIVDMALALDFNCDPAAAFCAFSSAFLRAVADFCAFPPAHGLERSRVDDVCGDVSESPARTRDGMGRRRIGFLSHDR